MTEPRRKSGPQIAGIVNITEDSFSDGGRFLAPQRAVAHAMALVDAGASLVDLGAASSHPDSRPVGAAREVARLAPVIEALVREGVAFGVDSFETETQRFALARGAHWLNDIQGFADPTFWGELAQAHCDLVVMHSVQGRGPATRQQVDSARVFDGILAFFDARITGLERAGVAKERIIVDPGMGFFLGATPEPSVVVLRRLARLRGETGCRLLLSVSRKSFLGAICADPETQAPRATEARLPATLATELYAARQGVDWIRTHDVQALDDALRTVLRIEGDVFSSSPRPR